ncbi:MAG: anthranilate phosphoribosyltransferase [Pseudomonadales bacterium]
MQTFIAKVIERQNLSIDEMREAMTMIMTGQATDAQIGGFLVALRMKGETVEEITGAAQVMRELVTPVSLDVDNLIDTCGTGGDGWKIFNVSTAGAIVTAASGAHVAKHGNRSVSSKSGSADLLEAAGVRLDLNAEQVARCVKEKGVGFMFAPAHHGAMKYAIGPRKELATRTIFNLLGPLTNPASAPNQVLGVYAKHLLRPIAEVLQNLGSRHVMVVHSEDGLDEISIAGKTFVAELHGGAISEYEIAPEDFGLETASLEPLRVETAEESLALIEQAFEDSGSVAADMIALNAGAAIYVSGIASSLAEGVQVAGDVIGSGHAKIKLQDFAEFTRMLKDIENY